MGCDKGNPISDWSRIAVPSLGGDRAVADGRSTSIFFRRRLRRLRWFDQPDRGDLDYAGVARHRPDDQPGSDHCHVSRSPAWHPALILIIAPIALMIAISHTLNKLATDSEIIVMNAAGFSPFRYSVRFSLPTAWWRRWSRYRLLSCHDGMRRIKQWDAEITADVLTNILQPGRFAQLDQKPDHPDSGAPAGGVLGGSCR